MARAKVKAKRVSATSGDSAAIASAMLKLPEGTPYEEAIVLARAMVAKAEE